MVTADTAPQRRQRPEYSLKRIVELAGQGYVAYASPRVQNHISNLGYTPAQVHSCLQGICAEHYKESLHYGDFQGWLDVYLVPFDPLGCGIDDLYIKLKLNKDMVTIVLCSFHLEGAL